MDSKFWRIMALVIAICIFPTTQAQTSTDANGAQSTVSATTNSPPNIKIECVGVIDPPWTLGRRAEQINISRFTGKSTDADTICKDFANGILEGTGDVVMVLDEHNYKSLAQYLGENKLEPSLYVNGINLGDDAKLISLTRFQTKGEPAGAILRYQIQTGERSKLLWGALYRAGSSSTPHKLNAALGFGAGPITSYNFNPNNIRISNVDIAITDKTSYWLALGAILALVACGLYFGYRTDILRDAKTPLVFVRAMAARRKIARRGGDQSTVLADLHKDGLVSLDCPYQPAQDEEYRKVARQALTAGTDLDTLDQSKLLFGLILERQRWHSARPSFSLGRTQLGLWFLFAVSTGIYLWLIYGNLPALDGSVLALLGLSAGVTGVSLAVDQSNPQLGFRPSQGLIHDLITDWNEQHQVYRFQAVVVNLLLLFVGIIHVSQHLTYPIFESTWLAFLGISGAALAAGKTMVETKLTEAPTEISQSSALTGPTRPKIVREGDRRVRHEPG